MGNSTPPRRPELEFELEFDFEREQELESETLIPETPLPRCLTLGVEFDTRCAGTANIPPAPRLPEFSRTCQSGNAGEVATAAATTERDRADGTPSGVSLVSLGLPTDRVLPGSAALVSTFRPKPAVRVCYSLSRCCPEERVYRPLRELDALGLGQKKRGA
jgi:hypothetical protein